MHTVSGHVQWGDVSHLLVMSCRIKSDVEEREMKKSHKPSLN